MEIEGKQGAAAARRARVLIVDDEPLLARTIVALLSEKHDPVAITQPLEALARLEGGERFDVILCDLLMPKMNGKLLFEAIGRVSTEQQERVVFLTGGVQSAAMAAFLDAMPNRCLDKPFTEETLLSAVDDLLGPS